MYDVYVPSFRRGEELVKVRVKGGARRRCERRQVREHVSAAREPIAAMERWEEVDCGTPSSD